MQNIKTLLTATLPLLAALLAVPARAEIIAPKTYYPSPYGSYTRISIVNMLKAGFNDKPLKVTGSSRQAGTYTTTGTVGVSTGTPQGALEINSANSALLLPRARPGDIGNPREGMIVFDPVHDKPFIYRGIWRETGLVQGGVFYIFDYKPPVSCASLGYQDAGVGLYNAFSYSYARYKNGDPDTCSYSYTTTCTSCSKNKCSSYSCTKTKSHSTSGHVGTQFVHTLPLRQSYVRTCYSTTGYMLSTLAYGSYYRDRYGIDHKNYPQCPAGFYNPLAGNAGQRTLTNETGHGGFAGGYPYFPNTNNWDNGRSPDESKYFYIMTCLKTSF